MINVGSVLNKRYKLLRLIGSGGTAHVYLAHDKFLDREVSVKVLRYDFTHDERALKRFQREAMAISELTHENIVSLYDVDNDGIYQYIVMEYVDGTDLKKFVRDNYPVAVKTVVDIMQQIAQAVSVAHMKGIIHRDLKPQNILINKEGKIKITDFGIATGLNEVSMTQTNTLIGSIHYLSPEQTRGQVASNQSDIYAMGIMMYELLTGNVPFNGDSAVSIAMKHFQTPMPSVKEHNTRFIPQSVENVILKATAKLPQNRYQSAQDMAHDLSRSLLIANHNVPKYIEPTFKDTSSDTQVFLTNNAKQPVKSQTGKLSQTKVKAAPKKQSKAWVWVMGVVISILAIGGFLFLNASKTISVPNVKGKSQTEATKTLTDLGLIIEKIEYKEDESVAKDNVIAITPEAGTTLKTKDKVTLIVSSGYNGVVVADYRNKSYEEAYADLIAKGFIVERRAEKSTVVDSGFVISQSILPNTKITEKNQVITLVVSLGAVTIAEYKNQKFDTIKKELESQGVKVIKQEAEHETIPEGSIISQSIEANVKIDPTVTSITFIVSIGSPVTIENYVGQSIQNVKALLNGSGLTIEEKEQDSVKEKGTILAQNISSGTKISKNSTLILTVSSGNIVVMPDLTGSSQNFAQNQALQLGLRVQFVKAYHPTIAKGTVSKQSVSAGTEISKNTVITLTISDGVEPTEPINNKNE